MASLIDYCLLHHVATKRMDTQDEQEVDPTPRGKENEDLVAVNGK